jgi:hypothetical protein
MAQKLIDRTLDNALLVCDGAQTFSSNSGTITQVGGANVSLDLGPGVTDFDVVIDASSVTATSDQSYMIYVVGGATASSQTYLLGVTALGFNATFQANTSRRAGRYLLRCSNVVGNSAAAYADQDLITARWIMVIVQCGGTTPSAQFKAYVVKKS